MEEQKFFSIIAEYANFDENKITMDMSFSEDLNVDSLDLMDIITAVEEAFGIEIDDEDYERGIDTVGSAYTLLKAKIEG